MNTSSLVESGSRHVEQMELELLQLQYATGEVLRSLGSAAYNGLVLASEAMGRVDKRGSRASRSLYTALFGVSVILSSWLSSCSPAEAAPTAKPPETTAPLATSEPLASPTAYALPGEIPTSTFAENATRLQLIQPGVQDFEISGASALAENVKQDLLARFGQDVADSLKCLDGSGVGGERSGVICVYRNGEVDYLVHSQSPDLVKPDFMGKGNINVDSKINWVKTGDTWTGSIDQMDPETGELKPMGIFTVVEDGTITQFSNFGRSWINLNGLGKVLASPIEAASEVAMDRVMDDIKIIPDSKIDMGESHGMRVTVATDESQGEYVLLNPNWDANGLGLTPQESIIRHVEEIGWYDAWLRRGGPEGLPRDKNITFEQYLQNRVAANELANSRGDISLWLEQQGFLKSDQDPGDAYSAEAVKVWVGYTGPRELVPADVAVVAETKIVFADSYNPRIGKHMKQSETTDLGLGFHLVGETAIILASPLNHGVHAYAVIFDSLGRMMVQGIDFDANLNEESWRFILEVEKGRNPTDGVFRLVE